MPGSLDDIERLFHEASALPREERGAFLDAACAGNGALRAEIDSLLAESGTRMDRAAEEAVVLHAEMDGPGGAPVPERIGEFRVIRVIGEGGMGRVYEAEQDSPRRRIALKVIRPGLVSRSSLRRLAHEADVLAGLKHPGIAQVYQSGSVAVPGDIAQPYFAMELVRGPTITAYVREKGLNVRGKLELLAKVCEAVQHAHQRGVIHRDLKPGNILVENLEGGEATPKVLDFGIARLTSAEGRTGQTLATELGQLIGTPAYMSPEQLEGDPLGVDTRSDVYALGVIGYELLAGWAPFDLAGKPITEVAMIVRGVEPARLGSVDASLRGDVETIIAKAMEKNRERRYASAAEMAADIARCLRDEPITARAPTAVYQMRKFARRNPGLVTGMAIGALAIVVGVIGLWVGMQRARESEARAKATAEREAAQRALAERRFMQVRRLAHTVAFDIYDQIVDLPGATKARETIVRTGAEYTDSLAKEAAGDPGLQVELAAEYQRLADLLGDPARANLGKTDRAVELARKAVDLAASAVQGSDGDPRALATEANALSALGNLLRATGKTDEAIAVYTRAVEQTKARLDAGETADKMAGEDAAMAELNLARMREDMGEIEKAVEHYRTYREYALRSAGADLADARVATNAAAMNARISDALARLGKAAEAEASAREGIELCERIVAAHPNHAPAQGLRAGLYRDLSSALAQQGRAEDALAAARTALAMTEEIVARDPGDKRAARNLGSSRFYVANALEHMERYGEALAEYEKYRDAAERNIVQDPSQVILKQDVGVGCNSCARMLIELKRPTEALGPAGRALDIHDALMAADPKNPVWIVGVLEDLGTLGEAGVAISRDASRPKAERSERLIAAKKAIDRGVEMVGKLRAEGLLPKQAVDSPKRLEELVGEADSAARALAKE